MSLCPLHASPMPCALCDLHSLGPLVYTLNAEQSKHFMHHMLNPKPPTPRMIEAARKMKEWATRPGDLEYASWGVCTAASNTSQGEKSG